MTIHAPRAVAAPLAAALLVAPFFLNPAAVWAGSASTWKGKDSDYNKNSNWQGPAPVFDTIAPLTAGQSAIFSDSGVTSIIVTGPISPDSWTFDRNSQSYTLTGGAVNFDTAAGIVNNAAGETISIGNDVGGIGGLAMHDTTGTLILSGHNSYSGATIIDNGATLKAGAHDSLSPNSDVTVNGTLDLNSFDQDIAALAGSGTVTSSRSGLVFLRIAPSGTSIFSGSITDGAGFLVPIFNGAGTTILTGNNSYSGTTNLNAGTLQIGNGGTTGTLGTGSVSNNAALVFNRSDTITEDDLISGSGSLTQAGAGTLVLIRTNNRDGLTTISAGTLQIGNGGTAGSLGTGAVTDNAALVFNRSNSLTVSGAISGSGSLTQAGSGTTILTGANSYGGVTTVSAGTLQIGNGGTSGSLGSGNVTNNAALSFNRSDTVTVPNAISGTGSLTQAASGTLILTGANSYAGATIINAGTLQIGNGGTSGSLGTGGVIDNAALVFNRSDTVTLPEEVVGTGTLTQAGTGTLILTGPNSYGGTIVSAGTLQVGNNGTSGSLGGGDVIDNAALVFNRSDTLTVPNSISGSGTLNVVSGTVILTNSNSYSGGTVISSGAILEIGDGGPTGSLGVAAASGGTIAFNSGTLNFNRGTPLDLDAVIVGTGDLNQNGGGTLTISAAQTYSGATGIAAGSTIALAGPGGVSPSSVVNDAGIFDISAISAPGTSINALTGSGSVNLGAKSLILTAGGGVFSGSFSGTGALEISGGSPTFTNSISNAMAVDPGATLQIGDGNIAGDISGAVTDNGALVFNHGNDVVVSGTISGAGTLTKSGSGTLILTGANSYGGMTVINSGTLLVGEGGTSGALGGGNVTDNATLVFARSDAITLPNNISGTGALIQDGGGNLILTGTNSYTGITLVDSGTLSVNGSITASPITVSAGGRLGGTGKVAAVTVASGGTIAPGNSIGTLTLASLTLEPGATTAMQVSPTDTDQIHVTGAASLQGALSVTHAGGAYSSTIYRLIRAGHVAGTFSSTSGALPGFTNILRYGKTGVDFIIIAPGTIEPPPDSELPPGSELPPVSELPPGAGPPSIIEPPSEGEPPGIEPPFEIEYDFGSYGMTPNQIAAGNALSAGSPFGALYMAMGALDSSDTDAMAATLGELAGDIRPSLRAAAIEDSRIIRDTLLDRMNRRGEGTVVWGAGLGSYGGIAGDGNAEALHHDSAGFLAGADFDVLPDLRLGAAAGYTSNRAHTASRLSAANGSAGHIVAYADWRSGDFGLDAGGDYGFGTVRITRAISQLDFTNNGSQGQATGQVFADAGYQIPLDAALLKPHLIIATSGAFAEGGDVSALSGSDASDSQTYAVLGLRAAASGMTLDDMDLTPRLDIGWQHAFSLLIPRQLVTYQDAGTSFLVAGTPLARDAALVQAGFDLSLGAVTLFVAYDGSFASTAESHAFRGGLNWQF